MCKTFAGVRHFAESDTLDHLPLTDPENFGTPVLNTKRKPKRRPPWNSSLYDNGEGSFISLRGNVPPFIPDRFPFQNEFEPNVLSYEVCKIVHLLSELIAFISF